MGEVLVVDQKAPNEALVALVSKVLRARGVVVCPCDSVYGIVCAALPNNPAHQRIFDIKCRDRAQTLPWFVGGVADLARYGRDVSAQALGLAEEFWPGALTLVVHASDEVPDEYVRISPGGERTIAVRSPDSALVCELVRAVGAPLVQTSANLHGQLPATQVSDLDAAILAAADLVLDGGPTPLGVASTIVDTTGEVPCILRVGAIDLRLRDKSAT